MRFAGDLFGGFSKGGVAGATGAYDPTKGFLGTMFTSGKPLSTTGAFGLPGYLASPEAGNTADSGGFGVGGFAARKSPFGLVGRGLFG